MKTYKTKVFYVEATQWVEGVVIDGVFEDDRYGWGVDTPNGFKRLLEEDWVVETEFEYQTNNGKESKAVRFVYSNEEFNELYEAATP